MATKSKNKRLATRSPPPPVSSSPAIVRTGLSDCYNFLFPNEYSDQTFGLLAFLLRHAVGAINFSDLIDEAEQRSQRGQIADFARLLDEKRMSLPAAEASIEKCLMLNRWISYIEQNPTEFIALMSNIRIEMKLKMADSSTTRTTQYPNDFRKREQDFNNRRNAQDVRRLFYLSHTEAKEPPSLIHLQNRTTEHLNYVIERMRCDSKFRETGVREVETILNNSFMIITQPHSGVNPVTIYERRVPGEYVAKVSVTIVSLLHDFMQQHPNLIELYDIQTSIWPLSSAYKLDESQILSWKTSQLQVSPDARPRTVQYAELSSITILQAAKIPNHIFFSDSLHALKFAIKVHFSLSEYKLAKIYQIPLETASFIVTSHNNHIPHMLTKIILNDIRRFSKTPAIDLSTVLSFVLRYFKHRTGVAPYEYLRNYVEDELKRALNRRRDFQTLEDIFMDFLVPFVHQVEFLAKHPVLSMFYADGLFLGICNSERAAEVMMNASDENSPIVGLRMNSIKIDYNATGTLPNSNKSIKLYPCAVRVDIFNERTKHFQYRTFDSCILPNEIMKFVTSAHTEKDCHIRILSNMNSYKSFTDFDEYYNDRLHYIYKTNEKYKPITNLIHNVEDGAVDNDDDDGSRHGNDNSTANLEDIFPDNPRSVPPVFTSASNHQYVAYTPNTRDSSPMPYAQSGSHEPPLQDAPFSPSQQLPQSLNRDDLVRYTLSRPDVLAEVLRQINIQSQPQMPYQNQQIPFQQPIISSPNPHEQNNTNHDVRWVSSQNPTQFQNLPMSEFMPPETAMLSTDEDLLLFDDPFAPN